MKSKAMDGLRLTRRGALGGALAAPWIGGQARAAGAEWVAYTYQLKDSAGERALQRISRTVGEATKGALTLKIHTAGRLGIDVNAMTAAVGGNTVQFGDDLYHGQVIAAAGVPRLPMLVPNPEAFARGAKAIRSFLDAAFTARGIVLLGHYWHPRMLTWSRLPFESLLGVAGHRIRSLTAEHGEFIRRLSGVPVQALTGDVAAAIDKTNIDTIFATGGSARMWRRRLRAGYASGPNHLDAVLTANRGAYNALPRASQEALMEASADASAWLVQTLQAEEDAVLAELAGAGLTAAEQQTSDIQAVTQKAASVWDEWARVRGRETQDLLLAFRRAMDQ